MRKDRNEKDKAEEDIDKDSLKWAEKVNDIDQKGKDEEAKDSENGKNQKMTKKKMIRMADEISSIGFPVAFALFLIIYIAITA